jgi:branched-subunit amino acid transport protein AzlD
VGEVSLTRILGARLMRAVRPPAVVEIVARVMEDGLFRIVVGQCLVDGHVCSVAALSAW